MTFKEKTAALILLTVARWLAPEQWQIDIKQIATNISVYAKEDSPK